MANYKERLGKISTIILDYDGVLTDGTIVIMSGGELLRTANVRDGYAIQLAAKKGYKLAIITGGKSESVRSRFKALGVQDIFIGVTNKMETYQEYLEINDIKPEEVMYMGDDIPDLEIMKNVYISACPSDAAEEIKAVAHYISDRKGGEGCVRDIIEQLMKIHGKWLDHEAFDW